MDGHDQKNKKHRYMKYTGAFIIYRVVRSDYFEYPLRYLKNSESVEMTSELFLESDSL